MQRLARKTVQLRSRVCAQLPTRAANSASVAVELEAAARAAAGTAGRGDDGVGGGGGGGGEGAADVGDVGEEVWRGCEENVKRCEEAGGFSWADAGWAGAGKGEENSRVPFVRARGRTRHVGRARHVGGIV